jgi:hypothetical protein
MENPRKKTLTHRNKASKGTMYIRAIQWLALNSWNTSQRLQPSSLLTFADF